MDKAQSQSYAQRELHSLDLILHLAHHRNRNQHRLSTWYKAFSTFRHQIAKLLAEVTELDTALAFSNTAAKSKKKQTNALTESKYVQEARDKVQARVEFWENHQMQRWYTAFSNLTADLQYAALGLMLLGCLARARSLIWQFSKRRTPTDSQTTQSKATQSIPKIDFEDDLGEVLKREPIANLEEQQIKVVKSRASSLVNDYTAENRPLNERDDTKPESASPDRDLKHSRSSEPAKKRKKKRKGDAFDDLFSGLF